MNNDDAREPEEFTPEDEALLDELWQSPTTNHLPLTPAQPAAE